MWACTILSPSRSLIKELIWHERPKDFTMMSPLANDWAAHTGACLPTQEGHNKRVTSAVFSHDNSRVESLSMNETIQIWDVQTGASLENSASALGNVLSFDTTNRVFILALELLTSRLTSTYPSPVGVPAFELQSPSASQLSQNPNHHDYRISSDRLWITRGSRNWLWLPPSYRPACSAVGRSRLTMVLGCQSGRVLIFVFSSNSALTVNRQDK